MEIAFIVIILAIGGIIKVLSDMNECIHCGGSGKKKIKIKDSHGEYIEFELPEYCKFCKGTGKKSS